MITSSVIIGIPLLLGATYFIWYGAQPKATDSEVVNPGCSEVGRAALEFKAGVCALGMVYRSVKKLIEKSKMAYTAALAKVLSDPDIGSCDGKEWTDFDAPEILPVQSQCKRKS